MNDYKLSVRRTSTKSERVGGNKRRDFLVFRDLSTDETYMFVSDRETHQPIQRAPSGTKFIKADGEGYREILDKGLIEDEFGHRPRLV